MTGCVCVFRVVRGAVGDGDACRAACRQQRRSAAPCPRVRLLCHPDRLHPAGDGGTVCFPACAAPPLVSKVHTGHVNKFSTIEQISFT